MKAKVLRFGKGFKVALGSARSQAATMVLEPGDTEGGPGNHHRAVDQWLFVVSGKGVAIVGGRKTRLRAASLVLIERGQNHEIRNTGTTPLVTLNIYLPPGYSEDGEELPRAKPKKPATSPT